MEVVGPPEVDPDPVRLRDSDMVPVRKILLRSARLTYWTRVIKMLRPDSGGGVWLGLGFLLVEDKGAVWAMEA